MDNSKLFFYDVGTITAEQMKDSSGEIIGWKGIKICDSINQTIEEYCAVRAFFEHEAQKSPHLRQTSCMISCRCSRCNPYTL